MASTPSKEHLDPELRAHVEGMHRRDIDRTLSDATLADEHRRAHEFGHPGHDVDDRMEFRLTFLEGMSIENPDQIGRVPAAAGLTARILADQTPVVHISRDERHAAKVAFELRVNQLLDLMRDASSEENRLMAYEQAVHTVTASVKLGLGHGALPSYEEMTA